MWSWLSNFLRSIYNFFLGIYDAIVVCFQFLWGFLCKLPQLFLEFFYACCDFFINFGSRMFSLVLGFLNSILPDSASAEINAALSAIAPYMAFVDTWVPLNLIQSCIAVYFTFLLTYCGINIIIKLIPGEG